MRLMRTLPVSMILLLFGMLAFSVSVWPAKSEPKTWIVDDDGPADFKTIQEAVNAAHDGDTVHVNNGTYFEHIDINMSISLIGEDRGTTIIDGRGWGIVIFITANNVVISGFTVQNGLYGIYVYGHDNATLSGNSVRNNSDHGIYLSFSSGNWLLNNSLTSNSCNFGVGGSELGHYLNSIDVSNVVNGKPVYYLVNQKDVLINPFTYPQIGYLALINSTRIAVENLTLSDNLQGILVAYTNNSLVAGNHATDNGVGIRLDHSFRNALSGNNVTSNTDGIWLSYSCYNALSGNNATNAYIGIILDSSSRNTLSTNKIADNVDGIRMGNSSDNILFDNKVTANKDDGVWIHSSSGNTLSSNKLERNGVGIVLDSDSSNNLIHHNNFENNSEEQAIDWAGANAWDNGYPSGGNYWSNCIREDLNNDSIGDAPYVYRGIRDNYPLMNPWRPMLGDVNDDGVINILDVSIVAKAFGTKQGSENWNPLADMDRNGEINILDVAKVAKEFGKKWALQRGEKAVLTTLSPRPSLQY